MENRLTPLTIHKAGRGGRLVILLMAAFLALVFVILASTAAQAYIRRYHSDYNYANQIRGSGFIDYLTGGRTNVGYTPPLGFQAWSYGGGTYNYYSGDAVSTGGGHRGGSMVALLSWSSLPLR